MPDSNQSGTLERGPDDQDPNRLRFDPTSPFYDEDLQEWVEREERLVPYWQDLRDGS